MKKVLFIAAIAALAFSACGNKTKNDTEAAIDRASDKVENAADKAVDGAKDLMHNAKSSLDFYGEYEGTIPAADAPGIKTTIKLNKDNTYTRKMVFVDRKDNIPEEKGNFTWNADGNIITLNGAKEANKYFVSENRLYALDTNGQRITGDLADKYILKKK